MKTTDKPICETDADGSKTWRLNGKRHRTDGPAVEDPNGYKAWFLNDKLHRTDGPAIELADGDKHWWLNGKRVRMEDVLPDPKDQFWWRIKS